jgi:hypothetical protein
MSTDAQIHQALTALLSADDGGIPLDNELLADKLGWDLHTTAACMEVMKDRSMIWGVRGSRKPGPWFSELEVTVQGKRFLRTPPADD